MSSEISSPVRSWSAGELPPEILHLILNNLSTISDQISFKYVCKHWYNAARQQKPKKHQLPLLLIPKRFPNTPYLYNLNTQSYVLPNTTLHWNHNNIPQRFCGSSFGWLASTDQSHLSFTNPFLSQTLTFPLPPGTNLVPDLSPDRTVLKAILSKDPTLFPNDYAVVAIHYRHLRLSYIKPGHDARRWIAILNLEKLLPFADVTIFNGRVYAVSYFGGLGAFNIDDDNDDEGLHIVVPNDDKMGYVHIAYLVESSSGGKLLQVRRFTDYTKTMVFELFVLEEVGGYMRWNVVNSLGEDALFLGVNDSMSILANNCESNCINYTDSYHKRSQGSYIDMGIYKLDGIWENIKRQFFIFLDDQRFRPLCEEIDQHLPPPVWIQPF